MAEIQKAVIGSVRLDSDVWNAVRAMPVSLNVYLRGELLGKAITPEIEKRIAAQVRPRLSGQQAKASGMSEMARRRIREKGDKER